MGGGGIYWRGCIYYQQYSITELCIAVTDSSGVQFLKKEEFITGAFWVKTMKYFGLK